MNYMHYQYSRTITRRQFIVVKKLQIPLSVNFKLSLNNKNYRFLYYIHKNAR